MRTLARWEAQLRMRRDEISNLGVDNRELKWSLQYKRAYFTDWRVCDRLKRDLMGRWDFVLDTNLPNQPRMAEGEAVRAGLNAAATSSVSRGAVFRSCAMGRAVDQGGL